MIIQVTFTRCLYMLADKQYKNVEHNFIKHHIRNKITTSNAKLAAPNFLVVVQAQKVEIQLT